MTKGSGRFEREEKLAMITSRGKGGANETIYAIVKNRQMSIKQNL